MADSAISGLPAAGSATGSLQIGCNDAGTSKRVTDTQISQLAESRMQQGVLCSHSASQTISSGAWTALALNQEQFKVGETATHSIVTNNSRLTAQFAGEYSFCANVQWEAVASDVSLRARVLKNGADVLWRIVVPSLNDVSTSTFLGLSGMASLSSSDYIELEVLQDRGGSLTLDVLNTVRFGMYALGR